MDQAPNLYLIGFMGTGKSSVGRELARRLKLRFIDSDHAIEQQQGRSVREIFDQSGEPAFRELEKAFIESGHPSSGCVVACGGGLPMQQEVRENLLQKGIVVCLFASPETILERTMHNDRRPLLQVEDPAARIRQLLSEREPVYMQTGIGVYAEGQQLHEVADKVLRVYIRECKRRKSVT